MTKESYLRLRATLNLKPSYGWLWLHIAIDLLLVGLPVAWITNLRSGLSGVWYELPFCLGVAVLLSIFYFRSFSMMHESVHGNLLRTRRLNDLLGLVYGTFCFLPFEHWREIHLLHHSWAGNVERDPVMKLVLAFRKPPTRMRNFLSLLWKSWFPILAILQNYVFWFVCVSRFREHVSFSRFLSLVLPLAVWGRLFYDAGPVLSALVLVPSILFYLAIVEVINFPHHMDLPQYEGETKLAPWEQYKIARSCFYSRALSRLVLLNFNYHTEHHLYPTLPWYRLDDLSVKLRETLPGYNFTLGHAWIRTNRRKTLEEVSRGTRVPVKSPNQAA